MTDADQFLKALAIDATTVADAAKAGRASQGAPDYTDLLFKARLLARAVE